jgi:hypothetical protein
MDQADWCVYSLRKDFPAQESHDNWERKLERHIDALEDWLSNPENFLIELERLEAVLRKKHHDYGDDNLRGFGELGILVRASDKLARLKNLADKPAEVDDESRADTWRDLAGYAIQALIMMDAEKTMEEVKVFDIRKNRLSRGACPDCGAGVLIRENVFEDYLVCSNNCGFITKSLLDLRKEHHSIDNVIDYLAASRAVMEQL